MVKAKAHQFHFVLNQKLKDKLRSLFCYDEKNGLSGLITRILSCLIPEFKEEHKWGRQQLCKYKKISEDPNEKREHDFSAQW